jgi:hypothetical protein
MVMLIATALIGLLLGILIPRRAAASPGPDEVPDASGG